MSKPPHSKMAITALLFSGSALASEPAPSWSYHGDNGPDHWGQQAAYETCSVGLQQSPIDLAAANVLADVDVSVDYADGNVTVRDTGKAIQVEFPAGSYLTTSGRVFALVQMHFHTPSEHTFNGKSYPLAAHFVHVSDGDALAVLGILFEEGKPNPELQKLLDAVRGTRTAAQAGNAVTLTTRKLLPDELEVFRYMGSLTTPPCTEGVHWHVARSALTASAQQLQEFEKIMGSNARPVLPLNGRLVIAPER